MFAGSHEDRRFALPSRNTTQLAQAVPEFSHSGTATRGEVRLPKTPNSVFLLQNSVQQLCSRFSAASIEAEGSSFG